MKNRLQLINNAPTNCKKVNCIPPQNPREPKYCDRFSGRHATATCEQGGAGVTVELYHSYHLILRQQLQYQYSLYLLSCWRALIMSLRYSSRADSGHGPKTTKGTPLWALLGVSPIMAARFANRRSSILYVAGRIQYSYVHIFGRVA